MYEPAGLEFGEEIHAAMLPVRDPNATCGFAA
jgi:hypothetical protein